MSRRRIWLFWGAMDTIYLIWYASNSFLNNRIPYLSDVISASNVLRAHGDVQIVMFVGALVLQASIFASCAMFFLRKKVLKNPLLILRGDSNATVSHFDENIAGCT